VIVQRCPPFGQTASNTDSEPSYFADKNQSVLQSQIKHSRMNDMTFCCAHWQRY